MNAVELRQEFIRLLTVSSPHQDMRRSDYNQAIFDAKEGWACFSNTDLDMVMEKFDRAIKNVRTRESDKAAKKERGR
jgi:hypothetical protein